MLSSEKLVETAGHTLCETHTRVPASCPHRCPAQVQKHNNKRKSCNNYLVPVTPPANPVSAPMTDTMPCLLKSLCRARSTCAAQGAAGHRLARPEPLQPILQGHEHGCRCTPSALRKATVQKSLCWCAALCAHRIRSMFRNQLAAAEGTSLQQPPANSCPACESPRKHLSSPAPFMTDTRIDRRTTPQKP